LYASAQATIQKNKEQWIVIQDSSRVAVIFLTSLSPQALC
jgi:hypothetical protein